MSLYTNVICKKEDLGTVDGYIGQSLSTIAAFRLMIASKEIRDQTRKSIGDTSQFSKAMKVLFNARYDIPKIKKECSTFDRAMKVWKSSDSGFFKSNLNYWEHFCKMDRNMILLKRNTKESLIEKLKEMTSSEFSEINLNNFEFMNKDDANQSDGEPTEMDEEPERCIYRDFSSGFGVIQFVGGNTYFGQLNEKGQPHGDGTVIIYDPDNPQVTLHQIEGHWENGELKIESQIFRVEIHLDKPGIFVGREEGNNHNGIFYEANGESPNTEIDNQGNFTFSYD